MLRGRESLLQTWIAVLTSVTKLGSSHFKASMPQEGKERYVSVLLLRFALWRSFHRAGRFPSVLINIALTKKPLMIRLIEQIHMTSNLQRWQLNLRKTDVSVLTERTSRLIFEKRKYENISYKKKKKKRHAAFCTWFAKAIDCSLEKKKKKSERQGACSPCFREGWHILRGLGNCLYYILLYKQSNI